MSMYWLVGAMAIAGTAFAAGSWYLVAKRVKGYPLRPKTVLLIAGAVITLATLWLIAVWIGDSRESALRQAVFVYYMAAFFLLCVSIPFHFLWATRSFWTLIELRNSSQANKTEFGSTDKPSQEGRESSTTGPPGLGGGRGVDLARPKRQVWWILGLVACAMAIWIGGLHRGSTQGGATLLTVVLISSCWLCVEAIVAARQPADSKLTMCRRAMATAAVIASVASYAASLTPDVQTALAPLEMRFADALSIAVGLTLGFCSSYYVHWFKNKQLKAGRERPSGMRR